MAELKPFEVIVRYTPMGGENAKADIQLMPERVEQLVRCKDCKHFAKWYKDVSSDTGYYCTRPNQQSCNLVPDDYCSYGERREDG